MKILRGGTTELPNNKWYKFDIELDESDLQAIVIKNRLDYDKLTVVNKFRIMSMQAELLVTAQMESQGVSGEKSTREYTAMLSEYIEKLPKTED